MLGWLRRRNWIKRLSPIEQGSLKTYESAEPNLQNFIAFNSSVSSKSHAYYDCENLPIMTASHVDRWEQNSRDDQYAKLNEIVERIGAPLKQALISKGAKAEYIHAYLTFYVKNEPNGEVCEIEGGCARLDYDPIEARREADAYNSKSNGFDRMLAWEYTYTLCGRVHGYFRADEDFLFNNAWQKKNGSRPTITPFLLLERIKLTIAGVP